MCTPQVCPTQKPPETGAQKLPGRTTTAKLFCRRGVDGCFQFSATAPIKSGRQPCRTDIRRADTRRPRPRGVRVPRLRPHMPVRHYKLTASQQGHCIGMRTTLHPFHSKRQKNNVRHDGHSSIAKKRPLFAASNVFSVLITAKFPAYFLNITRD